MSKELHIIADDLGQHPAVNRGIYDASEKYALTGADLMVLEAQAKETADYMIGTYPHVKIGLHINTFPALPELESSPMVYEFRGLIDPRQSLLVPLLQETERQLLTFQDMQGKNPAHISTHDHAHMDRDGKVFPQFIEKLQTILGEDFGGVVVRGHHTATIRHCRASLLQNNIPPLTPDEFTKELLKGQTNVPLELLAHPGLRLLPNEPPFDSDFTLEMREIDLAGLLAITQSQCIQQANFRLAL